MIPRFFRIGLVLVFVLARGLPLDAAEKTINGAGATFPYRSIPSGPMNTTP